MIKNLVQHALDFDPVAAAEDNNMSSQEMISLSVQHNVHKRNVLKLSGDTYTGIAIHEYLEICYRLGFEFCHLETFNLAETDSISKTDYLYILADRIRGAILIFNTSHGCINRSTVFYCFKAKKGIDFFNLNHRLGSGGWHSETDPNWRKLEYEWPQNIFDFDLFHNGYKAAEEGLVHWVTTIDQLVNWQPIWLKGDKSNLDQKMCRELVNDRWESPCDDELKLKRLRSLPQWVLEIINIEGDLNDYKFR